jgi:hypothetical protein
VKVERPEKSLRHRLGLVQNLLEEAAKSKLLKAVSMLLATLAEDLEEFLEALVIFVEGIAGNLNELRQILVRDVVYEHLSIRAQGCNDGGGEAE